MQPLDSDTFLRLAQPGMIIHSCRPSGTGSRLILWALNQWETRLCREYGLPKARVRGSHDAMVILHPVLKRLVVGESLAGHGAVLTPIEDYVAAIRTGVVEAWLFEVDGATADDGIKAGNAFCNYVLDTPYDYMAYPRLLCKAILGDRWPKVAGWEWAHWCTEGLAAAWGRAGFDPWQTINPTPLTTEHVAGWVPRKPGKAVTLKVVT